jgi:uroporphyrinogen-III synthase
VKALAGKRIIVTRPKGQAEGLSNLIREAGGEPLEIPAIEIRPLADPAAFEAFAARLESFDMAIFVSGNAVRSALALLRGRPWPARLKVATVGEGSRRALEDHGFADVIAPSAQSDSEALLALPEMAAVRGKRIAILRGDAGRELLGEELRKRGAVVKYVACYQRARPASPGELAGAWARGVDAVTVSSSEGLANFIDMLGAGAVERLARVALFVPHARVAAAAAQRGLGKAIVAGPGNAEMAAALVAYFGGAR